VFASRPKPRNLGKGEKGIEGLDRKGLNFDDNENAINCMTGRDDASKRRVLSTDKGQVNLGKVHPAERQNRESGGDRNRKERQKRGQGHYHTPKKKGGDALREDR